ncbi:SAP domain protein [Aspergillus lucknowensis]|uniref:SAP domain-containing protein n=1 Tax=Aspergillus lucknowensis TaxID=176173 RepID=A0ABR4LMF3_9EURO
MTDYSTWKVTDLKAELKRRGIPQTGLRVKQQIVDRLVEEDAKDQDKGANEAPPAAEQEKPEESQHAKPEPTKPESADNEPAQDTASRGELDVQREIKAVDEKPDEDAAHAPSSQPGISADRSLQPPQTEKSPKEPQDIREDIAVDTGDGRSATEAAVQPIEDAPGDVAQTEPAAPLAGVGREPLEKGAPSGLQTSDINTGLSTPLPAEELIEDVRKRKRRSQSPAPHLEEVANKKAKVLGDEASRALPEKANQQSTDETSKPADSIHVSLEASLAPPQEILYPKSAEPNQESPKTGVAQKQDMRFKGLFTSTGREQIRPASPPPNTEIKEIEVKPALHAATAALYIDGLMRPLQPAGLKNHLLSVAAAPGTPPNPDLIVEFYLDSIKTHCFARFIDVSTASRARNSLHDTVWPNERNRKSLFVDFIPENKVQEWIQREEQARGRGGIPPRWEVKYNRSDDTVQAILEEVDHKNAGIQPPRGSAPNEFTQPPPRGPRAEMKSQDRRPSGPSHASRGTQHGQGFKPLDELFKSTTAKPKLYYLPVPREIADRRLDRFDELLRKGSFPRRGGDETRRISFEDDDLFVDVGPEFGSRGRGGGRGRGRGGGMLDHRRDSRRGRY